MKRHLLLGTISALSLTGAAYAQESAPGDQSGVGDIIVTARRHEERLQDTPISVTAFTAATLERLGVSDIADIARRAPGMQFGDFGDIKLSPTSLRGVIANSGSAGADPAVGYYVDDVFIGQGAGANLDLYDVARVEVLRGPQGTLFGRNTIGGVVSITTERPSDHFTASALANFGNYNYRRFGASVSGPLAEHIAGKLAFISTQRDGVSDNLARGDDVNTLGSWSTRGQVLFDWGQSDLLITAEYREVDQAPLVFETLRYNDAATLPNVLDLFGLPRNADPHDRNVYSDIEPEETLNGWNVSATYSTTFGPIDFTSISSYRTHEYYNRSDTDRSPVSFIYDGDPEDVWIGSQELRFAFETGPLSWQTGLYYYRQNAINQSFIEIGSDLAALLGDPSLAGFRAGSNAELDTTSTSAYAAATWTFSDAFDATIGGRYSRDEKEIDYVQTDPLSLLGGDGTVTGSDSWSQFTPSFSARYRLTQDQLIYGSISSGFKSGGYNDALGDANGISFGPEELVNYEIGFKSELFNRRLRANVAVYYMDWSDIQITQDNPVTPIYDPIILNAGAAHSQGVEIELDAAPTDALRLGLALSLQEAEFDEGALPNGKPLRRIPYAPEYTAAFNAAYTWPITGVGDLTLTGEYTARGETFLNFDNQTDGKVDPYGLVNLRLSLESEGGHWQATLWGENLTDEDYAVRMFDLYDQDLVGQRFIALGDPLTFGLELRATY